MKLDDLLAAARTKDPKAREALGRALYGVLWPRFARSFSTIEAEDLVQTTMVLIFRRIDGDHEPPRSFEQLVRVTARRVELMARRSWARERARRVIDPPILIAPGTSLSERVDRHARVARIVAAADELTTTERRMLSGWVGDADRRRLAEIEGIARATLRTRVHRTLVKLRDIVQRRADGAAEPLPSST